MLTMGSLCTGYGGLDLATRQVTGARLAWAADPEPGPTAIINHRYPGVPNYGDITVIDWNNVEPVDILCTGFPCQDISNAGRRAGIKEGTRSGIWANVAECIAVVRPRLVVLENVSAITVRGLDRVLSDLAEIWFDAEWTHLRASDIGAPHRRDRWFCIAWPADTASNRRYKGRTEPAGKFGRSDLAVRSCADYAHHHSDGCSVIERIEPGVEPRDDADQCRQVDWDIYTHAINRWEHIIGRAAPAPAEDAPRGGRRLSARFVEWMMGLDPGWVTDVPGLSHTDQLTALGGGVVPQQAFTAISWLLNQWKD